MTETVCPAEIRAFPDGESASAAMAESLQTIAVDAVAARGRFLLVLNGGGTPQRLFENLGKPPFRSQPFWAHTHIFWGDERCVPPDQPGSNYRQAWEAFLDKVPVPAGQIYRIKGELGAGPAAEAYAGVLADQAGPGWRWPRFDLVLLGIGTNGHTASLFPGQPLADPGVATLAVTARYEDRPAERVSLSAAVFNSAREIWWMALGKEKAEIVRQVAAGEGDAVDLPALRICPEDGVMKWWLDVAAAGRLPQDP